jgi:hypothetical protein
MGNTKLSAISNFQEIMHETNYNYFNDEAIKNPHTCKKQKENKTTNASKIERAIHTYPL